MTGEISRRRFLGGSLAATVTVLSWDTFPTDRTGFRMTQEWYAPGEPA